jgi:hypothetical protein
MPVIYMYNTVQNLVITAGANTQAFKLNTEETTGSHRQLHSKGRYIFNV